MGSRFDLVLHGFCRLTSGSIPVAGTRTSDPEAMTHILTELAAVQKGATAHLLIQGEADVSWLAAFSECILLLDIAILHEKERVLYRSQLRKAEAPQVAFEICPESCRASHVGAKTSLISNGYKFICHDPNSRYTGCLSIRST